MSARLRQFLILVTLNALAIAAFRDIGGDSATGTGLLTAAPFQTSALQTLATSMAEGTWAELTTININPTLTAAGGSSGIITGYSDTAVWDPVSKQVFFIGGDHAPNPCYPRFVSYSDSTNTWQIQPQPAWFPCTPGDAMHGYNHTALDAVNGKLYHRPFNSVVVRKYDIASQTWTALPPIPSNVMSYNQCCTAVAWFPERQSLVYVSVAQETVVEYRESTGQWVQLAQNLPIGSYQNFAKYNPVHGVVVFGGGQSDRHMYKLDAQGVVTPLTDAPLLIGIQNSVVTVDPQSGKYLFVGNSNDFWVYDLTTDTWSQQTGVPPIFEAPVQNPKVFGTVVAPISTYGVNMYVKCHNSGCRVFLYKHYADVTGATVSISSHAPGAPVAGAVAISATASDSGSGVAGVQFKVNGINVGGEDTTAPYEASWDSTTVLNGTYTIIAIARDVAGNQTTSAAVPVTVNNATFNFSLAASNLILTQGQSNALTVTATGISGSLEPVSYALSSALPAGTTASFTPTSCTPICTTALTLTTSASTPVGSYTLIVQGTAGSVQRTTSLNLTVSSPDAGFAEKCGQPGVLSCFGFDSPAGLYYTWPVGTVCDAAMAGKTNYPFGGSRSGPGNTAAVVQNGQCVFPAIDSTNAHSGAGALKILIPSRSGPDSGGYFSEPFKRNGDGTFPYIGPGSPLGNVFYFQFYQRVDSNFLSTTYQCVNGDCGGWKQAIWYGNPPFGSSSSGIESTMYNGWQRNIPQMYGQQGHDDYGIQDIINCTYPIATSQGGSGSGANSRANYSAPLNPNCVHYVPDQWMEYTGRIEIRGVSNAPASRVQLWVDGTLVIDRGTARVAWIGTDGNGYGQFLISPYSTNKDPNQEHPPGSTWYDDLIVSTQPIPMMNGNIPSPDNVIPHLTNIAAGSINSGGATITWTTNKPANGQVDYGTTLSYGQTTAVSPPFVTVHSISLSGLSPSTTYHFKVKSRDADNNVGASQDFVFTTMPNLGVSPAAAADGVAGAPYNQTVSASGGTGPYSFSILSGALPAGLTLNTSSGIITGTPTTSGTATFTIRAVDSVGSTGTRAYTVTIAEMISQNVSLLLNSQTFDGTPSPGFVGQLALNFTLVNNGPPINTPMYFQLTALSKVGADENPAQPNVLLSADGGAGTAGAIQTLPIGPLGTQESAPIFFLVGVGSRQQFNIFAELYTVLPGSAATALSEKSFKSKSDATAGRMLLGKYRLDISESGAPTVRTFAFTATPISNLAVIAGAGSQSRPSIAVDPLVPNRIALASNDYAKRAVVVSTSQDGGKTWNQTTLSRTVGNQQFFTAQNPSLAFDSLGRLSVAYTLSNMNDAANAIVVSESSDGINFDPPFAVTSHLASEGVIDSRPAIATRFGGGRYLAWDSFSRATNRYSINVVRSDEGGLFGPATTVVSHAQVSSPALALSSTAVHVGWNDWGFNSAPPYNRGGRLMMASAPHGTALNFSPAREMVRTNSGFARKIPAMPEKGAGPNLSLAAHPKLDDVLYAVFADSGNGMDIRFARSADRGTTWQTLTVNDDTTNADQFNPAMAMDLDGNIHISFYDTRLSATFEAADVFLARSSNAGGSFSNQRITTVASNDSRTNPLRDPAANLGERTAVGITSGGEVMAWTDTRLLSEDIFLSVETGPFKPDTGMSTPKITWTTPAPILYGTPLDTAQFQASASTAGTFVYDPPLGTVLNAGNGQRLSVTFTPSDTAHFMSAGASVFINVLPAPLNLTANSFSRLYAVSNPPLTGSIAGLVNGDNITATYTTVALVSSPAGDYVITPVMSDPAKRLANYTVNVINGLLKILPAPLSVTASSASRFYGSANPALNGSIVGVVNNDNITAAYTTSAGIGSMPGSFPITPLISDPGGRLSNYKVTITNGVLTVVPAPIIALSSGSLGFSAQNLLSNSKTLTLTVGNIGTATLVMDTLELADGDAADFTMVNQCPKALAAGTSCTISATFMPLALGSRKAMIKLTDNAGGYSGSQQVVSLSGNSVLSYAVYATGQNCETIEFSGKSYTDSFDSSLGGYAKTKSGTQGDVAVNGNIMLSGNAQVNGKVYARNTAVGACKNGNPGITLSGKAQVTGGYSQLTPLSFATPPAVTPGNIDIKAKGDTRLPPGSYGDIKAEKDDTLILSPGIYNINSLKLTGGAKVTIAPAGPVILNIAGRDESPLDLSGGSVSSPSGNPANFIIMYPGNGEIELTGQADSYGVVYAPNAAARLSGKADWYGALVVKTLDGTGGSAVHYDRNLSK